MRSRQRLNYFSVYSCFPIVQGAAICWDRGCPLCNTLQTHARCTSRTCRWCVMPALSRGAHDACSCKYGLCLRVKGAALPPAHGAQLRQGQSRAAGRLPCLARAPRRLVTLGLTTPHRGRRRATCAQAQQIPPTLSHTEGGAGELGRERRDVALFGRSRRRARVRSRQSPNRLLDGK